MKFTIQSVVAISCFLLFFQTAEAQKVKMKKGQVLFDKEHVLDYTYDMMLSENRVFKKGTKDEILSLRFNNNGTRNYSDDDYSIVYFVSLGLKIESKVLFWGLKGEGIFKKLVSDGAINADGTLNAEKAEEFCKRYGEEIIRID
jgi:hypothetical protein